MCLCLRTQLTLINVVKAFLKNIAVHLLHQHVTGMALTNMDMEVASTEHYGCTFLHQLNKWKCVGWQVNYFDIRIKVIQMRQMSRCVAHNH